MSGLIPQAFIDDLLTRTDIIDIINECVPLKKAGKNHQACCPFHQEKTPSFTANQEKQFYYCFGCGAAGNAINFVMNYHHVGFPAAVEMLAQKVGLDVPHAHDHQTQQHFEKLSPLYTVSECAAEYYQKQRRSHPERKNAQEYLRQRGLTDKIINYFAIGYAPSGWSNLLDFFSSSTLSDEVCGEKNLEESGLMIRHETRNSLYDRFRKRIIFPIRDLRGRVVGFGGRALDNEKPKYLNSPETPIFHKGQELYGLYEVKQSHRSPERIIVVEGYMDVVALAQHGIKNAVATLGTATTAGHIKKLFRHTEEIVFCFDGDNAGRKAAWRAMESTLPAMEDGRKVRFLFLPQGEDPDSVVFRHGAEYFRQQLKNHSQTLDEYLLNHLASQTVMHTLDGKAQFTRQAQHYIQQLPNSAYQQLLIGEVAKRTELGTSIVSDLMGNAEHANLLTKHDVQTQKNRHLPFRYHKNNPPSTSRPRQQKIIATSARRAMQILLKYPALAEEISLNTLKKGQERETQLLVMLVQFLQTTQVTSSSAIRGSWHNTPLGDILTEVQLLDIPEGNPEITLQNSVNLLITGIKAKEQSSRPPREKLQAFKEISVKRKPHQGSS